MKYNPKVNEWAARQFAALHPLLPEKYAQGVLSLLYDAGEMLKEILGMDAFTLQPAAGAQGEMTGVAMIRAYHEHRGHQSRHRACGGLRRGGGRQQRKRSGGSR